MAVGDESVMQRTGIFLSLLPPTPRDHRLALVLVAISTVVFIALAPFAKIPLAPEPAFIPAYQAALFTNDAITSAMLFGQFLIVRTRALLFLASAYFFTTLIIVPHTLSFPGVFASGSLINGGPETTSWLYVFWHCGFPLLALGYAFTKGDTTPVAAPVAALLKSVAAVAAAVAVITLLTTAGHELLPVILVNNRYTPFALVFMPTVCGLSVLAFATLGLRRPHSRLDLWMIVVMTSWLFEVGIVTLLIGGRYDLGFYAGRIYGLFAASFVLLMLLLETRGLYARLASDLAQQRAAAENRAEAAHRTALETAETLRAVVNTSHQAVIAVSPLGTVLLWNKAAERMFGYSSDEVVGKPYPRRAPMEAEAEQMEVFTRVMAGEEVSSLAFRRQHKDGTWRDLRGAAAPFYDASGILRGGAYSLEDVTEKLATEEMLRQSQKMEAVGQLTGGVAHDFNNILMVILASVEVLQEDKDLLPVHRDHLDRIAKSGERAAELTGRLLTFSRKQRLQPQATNLSDLMVGTGKLLHRTLGEQVEVESILADDLWTTNVDRALLETTLVNLCVNARDAMPEGGRLVIETANADLDQTYVAHNPGVVPGQYVMLSVSDTGTGIPADLLGKVFEPFFTTKEVGRGTGLGLSMVYGFVKQSNGHIKIYSELGRGTTVRLYMPRSNSPAISEIGKSGTVVPRGSERILLVEDDRQVRASVLAQLSSLGYSVTEAVDGHAACDVLERDLAFDLMLTDVVMPGLDGPRLADIAATRWPEMKVIFMSGYSENSALNQGRVASNARVLSKPFRKIELAKRVREMLDGAA